jgi:hypothetical protein
LSLLVRHGRRNPPCTILISKHYFVNSKSSALCALAELHFSVKCQRTTYGQCWQVTAASLSSPLSVKKYPCAHAGHVLSHIYCVGIYKMMQQRTFMSASPQPLRLLRLSSNVPHMRRTFRLAASNDMLNTDQATKALEFQLKRSQARASQSIPSTASSQPEK